MKISREELFNAVKLASTIVGDHSIVSFTKVWLLKNRVVSFNGQLGVNVTLKGLPDIGGVDGKMLAKLLERSVEDDVDLSTTDRGELCLKEGKSKVTLHIMDLDVHIDSTPSNKSAVRFQVPLAALEDIQVSAMLDLNDLKNDPVPDLAALSIWPGEDKLTVFTCDRATLRRSYWSIGTAEHTAVTTPIYIPLNFMKLLGKAGGSITDGDLIITDKYALAEDQEQQVTVYSKLVQVETPLDFKSRIVACWPDGKFDKTLLVPVPDPLRDAVSKAVSINQDKQAVVALAVVDSELTIKVEGPTGKLTDTVRLKGHKDTEARVALHSLHDMLPQTERVYIGQRATVLFGPQRFAAFLANR